MDPRLELFLAFCAEHLKVESGQPLRIEPQQRAELEDYFDDDVRELTSIRVKKAGKTSLVAGVATFELCVNPQFRIAIAANSRDQALRVHQQISGFVRRDRWLGERLHSTRREVRSKRAEGLIECLAADVDHVDGWLGHRCYIDELHRSESIELYSVLRAGVQPLGGKAWVFSTAGEDPLSPLGRIRQAAYEMSGFRRDGMHSHVRNGAFAYHELALANDQDFTDMELVRQVHPSWVTVQDLRAAYESPTMTESFWRRFYAGQWVQGVESAVDAEAWARAAQPGLRIPDGVHGTCIGVDIGRREDCTAVIAAYRTADGVIRLEPVAIISPPADGGYITEREIMDAVDSAAERWPDATWVFDPRQGGDFVAERIDSSYPRARVVEFSQVPTPLARAAQRFTEALAGGRLEHPDETFTEHVLAAVQAPVAESFRFKKAGRHGRPVDALIAACMAVDILVAEPQYAHAAFSGAGHSSLRRPGSSSGAEASIARGGGSSGDPWRRPGGPFG